MIFIEDTIRSTRYYGGTVVVVRTVCETPATAYEGYSYHAELFGDVARTNKQYSRHCTVQVS